MHGYRMHYPTTDRAGDGTALWHCAACDRARTGYPTRADAVRGARRHSRMMRRRAIAVASQVAGGAA